MDENYYSLFPEKRVLELQRIQNIIDNTQKLCDHLNKDYCNETLRISSRLISSGVDIEKNKTIIENINSGNFPKFRYEEGKKYYKIIQEISSKKSNTYCFIDMETGELYKPATSSSPYKNKVYDLEEIILLADWRGNYFKS